MSISTVCYKFIGRLSYSPKITYSVLFSQQHKLKMDSPALLKKEWLWLQLVYNGNFYFPALQLED